MKLAEKDAEIAEQKAVNSEQRLEIGGLRNALVKQDERLLQMEMALAEVLRKQSSEAQVSSTH